MGVPASDARTLDAALRDNLEAILSDRALLAHAVEETIRFEHALEAEVRYGEMGALYPWLQWPRCIHVLSRHPLRFKLWLSVDQELARAVCYAVQSDDAAWAPAGGELSAAAGGAAAAAAAASTAATHAARRFALLFASVTQRYSLLAGPSQQHDQQLDFVNQIQRPLLESFASAIAARARACDLPRLYTLPEGDMIARWRSYCALVASAAFVRTMLSDAEDETLFVELSRAARAAQQRERASRHERFSPTRAASTAMSAASSVTQQVMEYASDPPTIIGPTRAVFAAVGTIRSAANTMRPLLRHAQRSPPPPPLPPAPLPPLADEDAATTAAETEVTAQPEPPPPVATATTDAKRSGFVFESEAERYSAMTSALLADAIQKLAAPVLSALVRDLDQQSRADAAQQEEYAAAAAQPGAAAAAALLRLQLLLSAAAGGALSQALLRQLAGCVAREIDNDVLQELAEGHRYITQAAGRRFAASVDVVRAVQHLLQPMVLCVPLHQRAAGRRFAASVDVARAVLERHCAQATGLGRLTECGALLALPKPQATSLHDALLTVDVRDETTHRQAVNMLESVSVFSLQPAEAVALLSKRQGGRPGAHAASGVTAL
ncbi:TIP-1 family-domain-containing protein [Tribonema minus]|uniref:TIP-1 family-domain-containing protein n=1 Tax=Tribonema minus TaxID=303371 RepID=A0A836CM27_9STRA|nr:TIP-1 family-domain-containing protein [Tribonema minus]